MFRKKKLVKEKDTADRNGTATKETKCYSNIENNSTENNINKSYFVLQKTNPSYELADNIIPESKIENPYNDAEDGTYDHLHDKDARKESAPDDTYNHASSVMSPDMSDYDVAHHKQVHEEDTTYDHTSPAENSYGHFDRSQTQETDYSELF